MLQNQFQNALLKEIRFSERIPASKLEGCIFINHGQHDPAGLCDGGDYTKSIQIRVENKDGDIYLSISHTEKGEWWSGTISWKEFFDLLMCGILSSDKIKHHTKY